MTGRRTKSVAAVLATAAILAAGADAQTTQYDTLDQHNGIHVSAPKVYDDRTLQIMLLDLSGRLGAITGFDQSSLLAKVGSLQGSRSSQTGFSLQAMGSPTGSVQTTANAGQPSVVTNTGGQYPGTQTTTPGDTLQTVTNTPGMAAGAPALPAYSTASAPTAFGVSAIDALNEQVQLNYELINLRLLLQGALNDQYTEDGQGRRHVTLGFPISIETPARYKGGVAEVQVAVCNPASTAAAGEPILQNVLPKEKTYNVASLASSSVQLGAGAVLANVVSVGGSFLHGRQTYYVVRDQDTVALERAPVQGLVCPSELEAYRASGLPSTSWPPKTMDDKNWPPRSRPVQSVTFAWQFRPVLGRPTVAQGERQTFAQLALPMSFDRDPMRMMLAIRTCWRRYDRKSGIAGDQIKGSCSAFELRSIQGVFETTRILDIAAVDNSDTTLTVTLRGSYPPGTQVALGEAVTGEGNLGFRNAGGKLRFTAPLQLVATRGAIIQSPDGTEAPISASRPPVTLLDHGLLFGADFAPNSTVQIGSKTYPLQDYPSGSTAVDVKEADVASPEALAEAAFHTGAITCYGPQSSRLNPGGGYPSAIVAPYSDSQIKVTLPVILCKEFGPRPSSSFPWMAVLNGKAFGLSDAPFLENEPDHFAFLAPKALLQGEAALELRRLLGGRIYSVKYALNYSNGATSGVSLFSSTDTETTFAIRGSQLGSAVIIRPAGLKLDVVNDTLALLTLTKAQLGSLKQIVIKVGGSATTILDLPAEKGAGADKAPSLKPGASVSRSVPQPIVIQGANLKQVAAVQFLAKPLPFVRAADGTSITITQFPPEMILQEGLVTLKVVFNDQTTQDYDVAVKS